MRYIGVPALVFASQVFLEPGDPLRRGVIHLLEETDKTTRHLIIDEDRAEERYLAKGCYRVEKLYKGRTGNTPAPTYESPSMTLQKCYDQCVEHRSLYQIETKIEYEKNHSRCTT